MFQNILLRILSLHNGSKSASLLMVPIFNIMIVSERLPTYDEVQALQHTNSLIVSIAIITRKHVIMGLSDFLSNDVGYVILS